MFVILNAFKGVVVVEPFGEVVQKLEVGGALGLEVLVTSFDVGRSGGVVLTAHILW